MKLLFPGELPRPPLLLLHLLLPPGDADKVQDPLHQGMRLPDALHAERGALHDVFADTGYEMKR